MPRAAIYARYSTDKQSESSLADQYVLCEQRAALEGYQVVLRLGDQAVSGTTRIESRNQGRLLAEAARRLEFEVLIVEGLDRLSRDAPEQETFLRRLEHDGLRVVGVSDGYDSWSESRRLNRGFRGIINAVYLEDLSKKTHRGLVGKVNRGMAAGGASFGYRLVKGADGSAIEVDPQKAPWVRKIFEDFAQGLSVQRIAYALNADGVPSPRGGSWSVSALYGSPQKGSGVLNNELYIGRQVWNRSRWVKHPDTGERQRRDRPPSEWTVVDRPDLRIIDDATWQAVRNRIQGRSAAPSKGGRPARTMFGGQLRCPQCGGAMIAVNTRSYGCGTRKDRGPTVCSNGALVPRKHVDAGLLGIVRSEVMSPLAVARFEQELRSALKADAERSRDESRAEQHKARLRELAGEIGRVVDAVTKVGVSDALAARLKELEGEKLTLEAVVHSKAATPLDIERVVRETMQSFDEVVATIEAALEEDIELARDALSKLLGRITLTVDTDGAVWADLENKTAQLPSGAGLPVSLTVVAGALGYETSDHPSYPEGPLVFMRSEAFSIGELVQC